MYNSFNELVQNISVDQFSVKPLENILLGTSGWSYKEWVGPFYERSSKKFTYYTKFFQTTEINSTFYRYPTRSTVYGFYRTSPKGFKFSAKLPTLITHKKQLNQNLKVKNDLLRFLELMEPLKASGKLGAILIQLPPSFVFERDYETLVSFLKILPEDLEFAVEFRDHSWLRNETWNLLKENNVAYTIVDEPLLPPETQVTADFAYIRWHGRGSRPWYNYHYSKKELKEWIPKMKKVSKKVNKIYGYFNNHYHGYAAENCIEILEMFNTASPEQSRIKEKIVRYNLKERPLTYERKIEEYTAPISELGVEGLLSKMTNKTRLNRAKKIKDNELTIKKTTDKKIKAKIRNYIIEIDLNNRTLIHNCDDWRKGLGIRRICKHIGKLFLQLPSETSIPILKDIIEQKNKWKFQLPTH
jgi:uncharacterized protein YecE (DUF72 family)